MYIKHGEINIQRIIDKLNKVHSDSTSIYIPTIYVQADKVAARKVLNNLVPRVGAGG